MPSSNSGKNSGKRRGRPENLKPWQPGQSGNPQGRPKRRLVDELLGELLEANGSQAAAKIARALLKRAAKGDPQAAKLVTERTQGKARQPVEIEGSATVNVNIRVL